MSAEGQENIKDISKDIKEIVKDGAVKANEVAQMYGIPAFTLINTEPDISPLLERFKAIHQHITDGEDFLPNFK